MSRRYHIKGDGTIYVDEALRRSTGRVGRFLCRVGLHRWYKAYSPECWFDTYRCARGCGSTQCFSYRSKAK